MDKLFTLERAFADKRVSVKMRIVHLSSAHNLSDPRFVLKMCPSLARAGHEVHIVIPGDEIPPEVQRDGVGIHLVKPPANRRERMLKTAGAVFKAGAALKGDIYHFHDPEGLPWALYWQKKLQRPFVYDVHECYPEDILTKTWIPSPCLKIIAKSFDRFEMFAAAKMAGLVAATDHIGDRFFRHPHMTTIHNYPLLEEFHSETTENHLQPGKFLFAGGLSKPRGLMGMIQGISLAAQPARLDLAGHFFSPNLYDECRQLHGWDRVCYHGVLNRSDLRSLIVQATAGLVLFHPEAAHLNAQPNKIFEYMAASLPVIASDFPLWRKIIKKNDCGLLVDPLKPEAVAEAMDYYLEHPEQAAAMGRRGRQAVERAYNWEQESPKLLKFYEELI